MSPDVSVPIPQLLEKMKNSDKDFRYMAVNDLMTELQKDSARWDDELEGKIVKMILELLDDKTSEVQNQSVKCLGPLVAKIKDKQVEIIVDKLCNNMVGDKDQLRDISSIGLKTVIGELNMTTQSLAATVCKTMVGRLSASIAQQKDESVQLEALDILADLLLRFGGLLVQFHPNLLDSLQPQLKSQRLAVRKRTIVALGHLVVTCDQKVYTKIIDMLAKDLSRAATALKASDVTANIKTYIQAIGMVCNQAGHRFREHVQRILPLILKHVGSEDEELQEQCLQACERIVIKCGKEVSAQIPSIIKVSLEYVAYDPNYNYDDDDDDKMDCGEDSDNEEDSDEECSDNEDMSWKVRKAAAKCLNAIISANPGLLQEFYTFSPDLINRFKEREENVKAEIFHAYIALLKQTKVALEGTVNANSLNGPHFQEVDSTMDEDKKGPKEMLLKQVPLIIKALRKQMKDKNVKIRQECFYLLAQLVSVTPNILGAHLTELVPWIQYSLELKESSSNIKIDTLAFLHQLIQSHASSPSSTLLQFLPAIITGVSDQFYKISSEALMILTNMVRVLRPSDLSLTEGKADMKQHANLIYQACLDRMISSEKTREILIRSNKFDEHSQEVEERAVLCMGQIVASLGDMIESQLRNCLSRFYDLLTNDRTRLITLKSFMIIARSALCIDISSILNTTLQTLMGFLQNNQRDLKVATLDLLCVLVHKHTTSSVDKTMKVILTKLPSLINDTDLHISQLTIDLLTFITKKSKSLLAAFPQSGWPEVFKLAQSSLLQGAALKSLLQFFPMLVAAKIKDFGYNNVLDKLINPIILPASSGEEQSQKHSRASVAKCVASIVASQSSQDANLVVQRFIDALNDNGSTIHMLTFSLLAIAEIGKLIDLSANASLKNVLLEKFTHSNEEVKSAASYTLGSICTGNLKHYLPFVLQQIENQSSHLYLLLHSLKEIISMQSAISAVKGTSIPLMSYIENVWLQLFKHCECNEEGTRNIVAECIGKLCLIQPGQLLPKLQDALNSLSPLMRSTILTAIKFMIIDQPHPIDALLHEKIGIFLNSVIDEDLNVKKMALVALNSASHNKPSLIKNLLPTLLPQLYNETRKRMELVRMVEMGPFKHEVDDGLDLRKAAFECMYTLLDTCFERLDVSEFLNHVKDGLKDQNDIKMLSYLMVCQLAKNCPTAVLSNIESLLEPLSVTLKSKLKSNALKQEHEKLDEVKRSAIRAITILMAIPEAQQQPKVSEILDLITKTPQLNELYQAVLQDSNNNTYARKETPEVSMDLN